MKKIIILFAAILVFFSAFSKSFAHGGVQNTAGNVTATFFISPLLPKVNESSVISFNLLDKNTGERLTNYPAILRIIETQDENEDHDKVLLQKTVKSDVNGSIEFTYKLPANKIYDIELEFPNVEDPEKEVGFLVQPEKSVLPPNRYPNQNLYVYVIVALLVGITCGYRLRILIKK